MEKPQRNFFSLRMIGIVHLPVEMNLSGAFKTASCSINYFYRMVTHKRIGYKGFYYFQTTLNAENLADSSTNPTIITLTCFNLISIEIAFQLGLETLETAT